MMIRSLLTKKVRMQKHSICVGKRTIWLFMMTVLKISNGYGGR